MKSLEAVIACCDRNDFRPLDITVNDDRMAGTAHWACLHCGRVWKGVLMLQVIHDRPDLHDQRRARAAEQFAASAFSFGGPR